MCILFLRSPRCNVLSPVYFQAVLHAPSQGDDECEMALSLANRSAALFHLQHYKVTSWMDTYQGWGGGGRRCTHYLYLLLLVYLFFIKYYYSYVLESLLFIQDTKDFNERWLSGRTPESQSRKPGF